MSVVGEGGAGVPLSRDPRTCLDRQRRAGAIGIRTDAADTAFSRESAGTGRALVPTQTHAFCPDRDRGRCRPRHTLCPSGPLHGTPGRVKITRECGLEAGRDSDRGDTKRPFLVDVMVTLVKRNEFLGV